MDISFDRYVFVKRSLRDRDCDRDRVVISNNLLFCCRLFRSLRWMRFSVRQFSFLFLIFILKLNLLIRLLCYERRPRDLKISQNAFFV